MTNFAKALAQRAIEIANDIQQSTYQTKKQLSTLEQEKGQLEAKLRLAVESVKRQREFSPIIGGNYQCPSCFVRRGKQVAMIKRPSVLMHDQFQCPDCNSVQADGP